MAAGALALKRHKGAVQPPRYVWSEVTARNLLTYSEEQDNAAWTKTGVTVSANAVVDSQGELTADKLVEDTGTSLHGSRGLSLTNVNHEPITVYAEVKAAERTLCDVWAINSSQTIGYGIRVDLTDGSVGSSRSVGGVTMTDYRVDDLGNGWYGVWVTAKTATTSTRSVLVNAIATGTATTTSNYTGDGSSGIYVARCAAIEDVQLGFPYYKTTDSVIDDERRRTQSTTAWTSVPYVNLYDDTDLTAGGDWNETNMTESLSNGVAELTLNVTTNKTHSYTQSPDNITPTIGTQYTQRWKMRAGGVTVVRLAFSGNDFPTSAVTYFDLDNGVEGTRGADVDDAGISYTDDGWWEIWATATADDNTGTGTYGFLACEPGNGEDFIFNGDGTSNFYVTEPMLVEASSWTPGSYVEAPTPGPVTGYPFSNVIYMFKGAVQPTKLALERRVQLVRARTAFLLRGLTRNLIN